MSILFSVRSVITDKRDFCGETSRAQVCDCRVVRAEHDAVSLGSVIISRPIEDPGLTAPLSSLNIIATIGRRQSSPWLRCTTTTFLRQLLALIN